MKESVHREIGKKKMVRQNVSFKRTFEEEKHKFVVD